MITEAMVEAAYHSLCRSEALPVSVIDVRVEPYKADPTGAYDSTAQLQAACNDAAVHVSALKTAIRAALEAAEAAAWQPIETAPKRPEGNELHGPSILLANRQSIDVGYWFAGDHGQAPGWEWDWTTQPTHWRPLPAPPLNDAPSSRG